MRPAFGTRRRRRLTGAPENRPPPQCGQTEMGGQQARGGRLLPSAAGVAEREPSPEPGRSELHLVGFKTDHEACSSAPARRALRQVYLSDDAASKRSPAPRPPDRVVADADEPELGVPRRPRQSVLPVRESRPPRKDAACRGRQGGRPWMQSGSSGCAAGAGRGHRSSRRACRPLRQGADRCVGAPMRGDRQHLAIRAWPDLRTSSPTRRPLDRWPRVAGRSLHFRYAAGPGAAVDPKSRQGGEHCRRAAGSSATSACDRAQPRADRPARPASARRPSPAPPAGRRGHGLPGPAAAKANSRPPRSGRSRGAMDRRRTARCRESGPRPARPRSERRLARRPARRRQRQRRRRDARAAERPPGGGQAKQPRRRCGQGEGGRQGRVRPRPRQREGEGVQGAGGREAKLTGQGEKAKHERSEDAADKDRSKPRPAAATRDGRPGRPRP